MIKHWKHVINSVLNHYNRTLACILIVIVYSCLDSVFNPKRLKRFIFTLSRQCLSALKQGWHLSFTQVLLMVKYCLGKTGKNWAKPLFFPLNGIVLPIGWSRFSRKMKQFYPLNETSDAPRKMSRQYILL